MNIYPVPVSVQDNAHTGMHTRAHAHLRESNKLTGSDDPVSVAVNVDDFSCLHMALGPKKTKR